MKEVHLGRMIGPFASQPITPLICSPVGMVEKKNSTDMRCVTHLSYPKGSSINAFINPAGTETHYQMFEAAVNLVAKAGQGAFMAKEDFKSAFHKVLIVRFSVRVCQLINIYCHGSGFCSTSRFYIYIVCVDRSGSLSGCTFNQLRLVLTILY